MDAQHNGLHTVVYLITTVSLQEPQESTEICGPFSADNIIIISP